MNPRDAGRIRLGIKAGRLPHRLRHFWVLRLRQYHPLTVRAFERTYSRLQAGGQGDDE